MCPRASSRSSAQRGSSTAPSPRTSSWAPPTGSPAWTTRSAWSWKAPSSPTTSGPPPSRSWRPATTTGAARASSRPTSPSASPPAATSAAASTTPRTWRAGSPLSRASAWWSRPLPTMRRACCAPPCAAAAPPSTSSPNFSTTPRWPTPWSHRTSPCPSARPASAERARTLPSSPTAHRCTLPWKPQPTWRRKGTPWRWWTCAA